MTTLPKYERYKDSEIEWADTIPSHWDVKPGRVTLSLNKEKNAGNIEETVLSLSYGRLVIKPPEKMTGLVPESLEGYQIINPGDIIIRPTDLQNDWTSLRVGLAKNRGIITSAYLGLKHDEKVSSEYLYYLLHSYDLLKVYYGMGTGLRQNLSWDDFKYLPLTLPPKFEQDRIVAFLDQKTAEIDALIAKKQRQIELLDEQKAILINSAVTRGLNPNAKLKPSGIQWIGDIPEHWEVSSIRRQASFVTSGSRGWAQYSSPSGPLFLRICNLSRGSLELRLEDIERVMPPRGSEGERTKVASGDVLISITAFIGSIGVVPDEFEEAYVSQHIALVRIKPSGTHPKWIGYSLLSELGAIQSNLMMYGGTKVGLSLGDVKNYCFPVPPQNEQVDIVEHIAAVFSGYTRGVSQFEKEIQSLKILRSTLIAHAVTGRIKV